MREKLNLLVLKTILVLRTQQVDHCFLVCMSVCHPSATAIVLSWAEL